MKTKFKDGSIVIFYKVKSKFDCLGLTPKDCIYDLYYLVIRPDGFKYPDDNFNSKLDRPYNSFDSDIDCFTYYFNNNSNSSLIINDIINYGSNSKLSKVSSVFHTVTSMDEVTTEIENDKVVYKFKATGDLLAEVFDIKVFDLVNTPEEEFKRYYELNDADYQLFVLGCCSYDW